MESTALLLRLSRLHLLALLLVGWWGCSGCVEERKAFLDIKAAFTAPGSSFMLESWEQGGEKKETAAGKERVRCDSSTGRLVQLHLSSVWRYDGIHLNAVNASLFLPFQHLRSLTLTLTINAVIAWLPSAGAELSMLKNLETLDLSSNHLSGGLKELEGWPFLKELSLSHNMLSGTLPLQGFCKTKKLEILDLSENTFVGVLPPCIANLTSLGVLDLTDNHFQVTLPSIITNLTSLEYLYLSNNQLEGILYLNTLSNHSKLKALHLDSYTNSLEVETESPMATPLLQLESLALSNCNLNSKSGAPPSFISSQYKLQSIDLSGNQLKGHASLWLPENKTTQFYLNL